MLALKKEMKFTAKVVVATGLSVVALGAALGVATFAAETQRVTILSESSESSGWDSATQPGTRKTLTINGVEYAFRWAPPGTCVLGSPANETILCGPAATRAERFRNATFKRGFWVLETEVTQEMWESVMGSNPSYFSPTGPGAEAVAGLDASKFPVERVVWEDCQRFLEKLNEEADLPSGFKARLPFESEWEYVCRAGTQTPFSWGSRLNGDKANCKGDAGYGNYAPNEKGVYLERSCEVRSYEPNPWGLYDMHGNVAEWCSDSYAVPSGNRADVSDKADPARPIDKKTRIVRGGSWGDAADDCRSAANSEYRHPAMRLKPAATDGFRFILYPTK